MLTRLSNLFYRLPHKVQQPLQRGWYEQLSRLDRDADMVFMNYGWADLDPAAPALPLQSQDEPNRICIQLYHRVAGAIDLTGLDVLEVGCGRGGGASFVMRYLRPRSFTGLDLTANAIAFCKTHHTVPGLSFVRGDAETLSFDPASFDAVINVESSHCYGSMDAFLNGVRRVLKPGGHLLYADHRLKPDVPTLRRQFEDAGLAVIEEEMINANILKALELDEARKQALIKAKVPRLFQPFFNEFACMAGAQSTLGTLCSGERLYMRFVMKT
jgi:ubiquinone/menaquinone biosynthesis C-methylase UbiE